MPKHNEGYYEMNDELPVIQVLIIDDEADICVLLGGLLKQYSIPTEYATSLKEAKSAIGRFRPEVLLLDNHLKDGLGLDFIPYIKTHLPMAKIIMISAFDGKEEHEKAMKSGVYAFIGKPFCREDILAVIEDATKNKEELQVKDQKQICHDGKRL